MALAWFPVMALFNAADQSKSQTMCLCLHCIIVNEFFFWCVSLSPRLEESRGRDDPLPASCPLYKSVKQELYCCTVNKGIYNEADSKKSVSVGSVGEEHQGLCSSL